MLKLHFLNVDNGDCIIIEYEDNDTHTFGVMDCNRTSHRASAARDKLIELGATQLSFVCLTHPDRDHYSGLLDVLTHFSGHIDLFLTFPLDNILASKKKLKQLSLKYLEQAESAERGGDPELARGLNEFVEILKHAYDNFLVGSRWHQLVGLYNAVPVAGFSGAQFFSIMPPAKVRGPMLQSIERGEAVEDDIKNNAVSAALMIEYAGNKILLGGDATGENWDFFMNWSQRIKQTAESQIVKIPHHGSKRDNSPKLLATMYSGQNGENKKIAILSADGVRHPDAEVMIELERQGVDCYCTNLFQPGASAVHQLITDAGIERRLLSSLNLVSEGAKAQKRVCQGDITISINPSGYVGVSTERSMMCACRNIFNPLFVAPVQLPLI